MKKTIFKGAATALITPFYREHIDKSALVAIVNEQIDAGIDALVVCGTTGEASTMSDEERADAISVVAKAAKGRIPVIAGASSNNTAHSVELCKSAVEAGADALLCVTPYYNKTSQRGLVASFTAIADKAAHPIIIYNVPSRTGVDVAPQTYKILAEHPNICAIKEADGNISKAAETLSLVGRFLDVYSGNDDMTVPLLSLGGMGVISVLSNVFPSKVAEMCRLYFDGKQRESAEIQLMFVPLIKALFSDVNPVPVKDAMAMLGKCAPDVRLPLVGMSADRHDALRHELLRAGAEIKNE